MMKKIVFLSLCLSICLLVEAQDTTMFRIDEVQVIQHQKTVTKSHYSGFNTDKLSSAEICRAACCNLSESFETSAAVDVAYADAATGMKQIRLLGLSGTYVQLLGENCPAVRGLAQSFGMEYVPGSWMESIQVSKGTSSVLNGYEAITGQINVEYLKPQKQSPIAINAMINKELNAEVNITGGWQIPLKEHHHEGMEEEDACCHENLSTGIMAHYQNSSWGMDENKDGFLDKPKNQNLNILNRWWYKHHDYSFQFLIRGIHDERHGGQRPASVHSMTMPSNPYLIDLRTDRVDGFMKHGYMINEESAMSIGIVTAASYHQQENHYGTRQWNASQANAYLNAIFQNAWEGGKILGGDVDNDHKLSVGLSVNYDQYWEAVKNLYPLAAIPSTNNEDLLYSFPHYEVTTGLFAEYTYKIAEKFTMIAGLRGDYSTKYGFFVTPRLNVRYQPFEWWTLRGSVGLGYRSPNLIADNAQFLPSNRLWTSIKPHQERSINTGLTTMFDIPLGSKTLTLSAEYYFTYFFDGMIVDLDRDRYQISFYNLAEVDGARSFSHNAQIEATMEILSGWTMTAAFRYTDVRQSTFNAALSQYQLREKALQNRFKAILTTSYVTPKKSWQFDVTAQFNGPGRMYDGFVVPEGNNQYYSSNSSVYHKWYPQLMAQVTKYFKHNVSLYLGAENMTNFKQENPVLGDKNAAGVIDTDSKDFDASTVWAPTMGWNIYLGLRWSL